MLRFAHAAETAAYYAYDGHWRSLSDPYQQMALKKIQLDELKHIYILEKMLDQIGYSSDPFLNKCGRLVGQFIGTSCFYFGWRLPMWVAGLMEKIGTSSYNKIAIEAADVGMTNMAAHLIEMARIEEEHKHFFDKMRKIK